MMRIVLIWVLVVSLLYDFAVRQKDVQLGDIVANENGNANFFCLLLFFSIIYKIVFNDKRKKDSQLEETSHALAVEERQRDDFIDIDLDGNNNEWREVHSQQNWCHSELVWTFSRNALLPPLHEDFFAESAEVTKDWQRVPSEEIYVSSMFINTQNGNDDFRVSSHFFFPLN